MALLDWIIIAGYLVFTLIVGLVFTKKAGENIREFFLSGSSLPWWIAGTSIAATTFAVDTPLAVTGLVAEHGIAGNWFWWSAAITGITVTFLYSKLWRRTGVLTDAEFIELRYSGKWAAILRAFKGFYFGIIINCFTMAWVIKAMLKLSGVLFGIDEVTSTIIFVGLATFYTVLSGFWGIVVTDLVQFIIAVFGAYALTFFALDKVGGIEGLKTSLEGIYGNLDILSFFPTFEEGSFMPMSLFLVYIGMLWWANKYADGGGIAIQRILSCKDEKQSLFAVLWFNFVNYIVRSWPWIITALVALVLYPGLKDPELGYIMVIKDTMPTGFLGIMITTMIAAFMSTIDTHLNWGASYLLNDIYKRFINKNATEKHYVMMSRFLIIGLVVLTSIFAWQITSIVAVWKFILAFGSGAGLVFLVRWFWWRVNALSEISAMLTSAIVATVLYSHCMINGLKMTIDMSLPIIIGISTAVWITVTFLSKPADEQKLLAFYKKVRPVGGNWKPITEKYQDEIAKLPKENYLGTGLIGWVLGLLFVYCLMFGIGYVIFGNIPLGTTLIVIAIVSVVGIFINESKSKIINTSND